MFSAISHFLLFCIIIFCFKIILYTHFVIYFLVKVVSYIFHYLHCLLNCTLFFFRASKCDFFLYSFWFFFFRWFAYQSQSTIRLSAIYIFPHSRYLLWHAFFIFSFISSFSLDNYYFFPQSPSWFILIAIIGVFKLLASPRL